MNKKLIIALLTLVLSVCLSGCLTMSADELYALPRQSEAYLDLQTAIDEVMPADGQYSSPISGANQQPVQMSDLDGDGEDEALVFVKTADTSPLKIYIFDRVEDQYRNIAVIEGDGSAFARVEYAQMDGVGGQEIVVGRQISGQVLQAVSVYRFTDGAPNELMTASYSMFTLSDLDGDENRDLFLLRYGMEEQPGTAALYRCTEAGMERAPELQTAVTADTICYFASCSLTETARGILVSRVEGDALTTEIYTLHNGLFKRISTADDLNLHSGVLHGYNVYPSDADLDGCTEIPDLVQISGEEGELLEDTEYAIRWYSVEPNNKTSLRTVTYHSYASGWYLQLPDAIGTDFHVSRLNATGNMRGISFYEGKGTDSADRLLVTIYAFSGSDRTNLASMDGRFPVATKGDITYAALLGNAAATRQITQEDIVGLFHFVHVDWNSGET